MNQLSEKGQKARNQYQKEYRKGMSPEARKAATAYIRAWRKRNPEKVRQHNIRYWERRAAKLQNASVTANRNNDTAISLSVTKCQNCGKDFSPKRSDAKYCSDTCRVQFNRKNK